MLACDNSRIKVNDQFAEVGKLITHAKGGQRKIVDYKLTRYACYLIVQNSDPRKKVIALGQTYFAIQTRKQEVRDYFNKLDENKKRLDYMNSQELIANLFRISHADEKIKKEKVSNKDDATLIHNKVGQEVRNAIKRVDGVLPENQPTPERSIDEIAKEQIKKLKKKKNLFLDE